MALRGGVGRRCRVGSRSYFRTKERGDVDRRQTQIQLRSLRPPPLDLRTELAACRSRRGILSGFFEKFSRAVTGAILIFRIKGWRRHLLEARPAAAPRSARSGTCPFYCPADRSQSRKEK